MAMRVCSQGFPGTKDLNIDVLYSAGNDGAIPFNTQFFHEDFDEGPGFDDVFDGGDAETSMNAEPGEQDLLAATQGRTRRVRPDFVNYAKRAKRVDVRKLKENNWTGLDIVVVNPPEEEEVEDMM